MSGFQIHVPAEFDDDSTVVIPASRPYVLPPGYYLEPMNGTFDKLEVDLSSGSVKLGRHTDGQFNPQFIGFVSKVVSRVHAELFKSGNKLFVRDLGSSSGTFVNSNRLMPSANSIGKESGPMELRNGDVIQLGSDFAPGTDELSLRCILMRVVIREAPSNQVASPGGAGPSALVNALTNLTMVQPGPDGQIKQQLVPISVAIGKLGHSTRAINSPSINTNQVVDPMRGSLPTAAPSTPTSSNRPDMVNLTTLANHARRPSVDVSQQPLIAPTAPLPTPPLSTRKASAGSMFGSSYSLNSASMESLPTSPQLTPAFVVAEQLTLTVTKDKSVTSRVQVVNQNGKETFTVNVKAWSNNRKLLIEDHRAGFSKIPYMEVIPDNTYKNKFTLVNQSGGSNIATIDKKGPKSCIIESSLWGNLAAGGDFDNRYSIRSSNGGAEMSEVTSQQFTKSGNTTVRVFNVALSKDVQPHLVVSTVVLLTLLLDQ